MPSDLCSPALCGWAVIVAGYARFLPRCTTFRAIVDFTLALRSNAIYVDCFRLHKTPTAFTVVVRTALVAVPSVRCLTTFPVTVRCRVVVRSMEAVAVGYDRV